MKKSLTAGNIKSIDKSNMLAALLDFPLQCRQALAIAQNLKVLPPNDHDFKKIIFACVGGSAIGADLVKSYLYFESKIPITVIREYELPAYADRETLIFIVSYSGNTEEALSVYKQARERGAFLIVISSGGKLKEYAKEDQVAYIEVPQGLPPRYALGYLSIIPLYMLTKFGLIRDTKASINQAIEVLEGLKIKNLNPRIGQKDNISKYIAAKLFNKFPVIYSSSIYFDVVANRFRCQLNENSKTLALSHLFPEMNHNEIMGWYNPKKLLKDFVLVMFRDKNMHPKITRRMDITRDMLKEDGVTALEVWSRGEDLLSRIFSLIYIGDFISYYLAILYGIDPAPSERIAYIKKELAKR